MAWLINVACCRCVPGLRRRAWADPKKDDEYNEETARLLDSVLDSDDEQGADALSPEEIRRFLDASRAGRLSADSAGAPTATRASSTSSSSTAPAHRAVGRRVLGRGGGDSGELRLAQPPQDMQMGHLSPVRTLAPVPMLIDGDYDELFDEELEDEPEHVIVGHRLSAGAPRSPAAAALAKEPPLHMAEGGLGEAAHHRLSGLDADERLDAQRRADRDALDEWLGITEEDLDFAPLASSGDGITAAAGSAGPGHCWGSRPLSGTTTPSTVAPSLAGVPALVASPPVAAGGAALAGADLGDAGGTSASEEIDAGQVRVASLDDSPASALVHEDSFLDCTPDPSPTVYAFRSGAGGHPPDEGEEATMRLDGLGAGCTERWQLGGSAVEAASGGGGLGSPSACAQRRPDA
mmetsp:Transcript_1027/g.2641  ORF Transcript_1027/g.2641 Transcript_1027/m.2641 type:complete len:407 (-) Transcript_1027:77-1297(-)